MDEALVRAESDWEEMLEEDAEERGRPKGDLVRPPGAGHRARARSTPLSDAAVSQEPFLYEEIDEIPEDDEDDEEEEEDEEESIWPKLQ